ncbi:MAG: peptidoglycan DD-metalloendopeptidase family protein [Muribaculaceae bacterium]|nr:peptidoglycan DD-metalloendopeptidase family protein [Muribaculaceae bacterium]
MQRIKTILLTLAAIAAGTSATRADEMSDLVAAVAASMEKQYTEKDVLHSKLDMGKPRYSAKPKNGKDLNVMMLDGIISSMKRETFRKMRKDLYGDNDELDMEDSWRGSYPPPTLGRADFFRPVPGIITSRFGWRSKFNRMHHGVDLSLHIGDTVRAAISGTVERISYDHDGYGHYVVMTHPDGMETLYGHLEYALVSQGQTVFAGQPVGIGGNTGNSTGPHLHFEARVGGVAIDPTLIFDFYGHSIYYADETPAPKAKAPVYTHQSKSLKKEDTYIVRVGDTQESVARQAGITVMRLCQLNMLQQSEPLPIGRMLKLK